jgi:alpha-N-arabinofuranosidase
MMKTDSPERDIQRAIALLDKAGYGGGKIKIAYDEWNLRNWHHPWHGDLRKGFDHEARRKNDIASTYTMADAIFSACFLNACLRHADIVDIACFSPVVNTRGAIRVDKDGITRRTTYYTLLMYTNYLEANVLPIECEFDTLTHNNRQTTVLDAVLTSNADGTRKVLAVANKSAKEAVELKLDFPSLGIKQPRKVDAWVLSGRSEDDYNDRGDEHVRPVQQQLRVKDSSVSIPAHSITFLTLE